jgi:Sec-independent protein translocase protein TatA
MFEIGWTEVIVVVIVGCLVLDIKDISKIIKWIHKSIKYCNNLMQEFKQIFHQLEEETNKIIGLDGNEHTAYDLDDITPDLKKDDNENGSKD